MIRYNPYDVKHVLFLHKDKYQEIKGTAANARAAVISSDSSNYYLYPGAFKTPELDPEKIYDSGNLKDGIYVQECRLNLKINSWLINNVFRRENNYVLSKSYKYKYKYVDIFNAERRNLPEKTQLSTKMVIFFNKNYEILFVGLIDTEENIGAKLEENFELKLYSMAYLINKVLDIEVCLYDKDCAFMYNDDTQFGLPGTNQQNPQLTTQITGKTLKRPHNIVNLTIFEAMRYYFGDNIPAPGNAPPTYLSGFTEPETGSLMVQEDIAPSAVFVSSWPYHIDLGVSFMYGNYIYFCFTFPIVIDVLGTPVDGFIYRYYRHAISDSIEVLTDELEYYKTFDAWYGNFAVKFKDTFGYDIPPDSEKWDQWVDNPYYCKLQVVFTNNHYHLQYNYKLPPVLDFDICEGDQGKMLKLGDLCKLALAYGKWYIDMAPNGETFIGRPKRMLCPSAGAVFNYDDNLEILTFKQLSLEAVDFDCFNILNINEMASEMQQKVFKHIYNVNFYGAALEEVTAVTPRIVSADTICTFGNHGKFLIVQTQPVYDQNGFKYSNVTMWRLTYGTN